VWLHKAEYHEPADLLNLVFGTKYRVKYRRKVFAGAAIQRLRLSFEKVGADFQAQLVEMDEEADQVHLLIHYPPKPSVSAMVNSLKGCFQQASTRRKT